MIKLRKIIGNFLPLWLKTKMIKVHQLYTFARYFPQFKYKLLHDQEISDDLIRKIVYGWGNMGFSSEIVLTKAIIRYCNACQGPVIECGSGLSTVIMGIIAQKRNIKVYSLEHHEMWYEKISKILASEGLNNSIIYHTPLKDYGDYDWYDLEGRDLPADFDLVLCDGPPAQTRGGRYGLLPLLRNHFASDYMVILDDSFRPEEREIITKWEQEFHLKQIESESTKIFAVLKQN